MSTYASRGNLEGTNTEFCFSRGEDGSAAQNGVAQDSGDAGVGGIRAGSLFEFPETDKVFRSRRYVQIRRECLKLDGGVVVACVPCQTSGDA